MLDDTTWPVIFTEGETRSCAWAARGMPVLSFPGIPSFWGKDGELLPLAAKVAAGREITIAWDSDQLHNDQTKASTDKLVAALYEAGATRVTALDVPAFPDGRKCGLDDFAAAYCQDKQRSFPRALAFASQSVRAAAREP